MMISVTAVDRVDRGAPSRLRVPEVAAPVIPNSTGPVPGTKRGPTTRLLLLEAFTVATAAPPADEPTARIGLIKVVLLPAFILEVFTTVPLTKVIVAASLKTVSPGVAPV